MSTRLTAIAALGILAAVLRPAEAAIKETLYDATNCVKFDTAPLAYVFCDDGVPPTGGTSANIGGVGAITVPAEYDGDGFTGLPARKVPTTVPGADANGDIALDVNITWPDMPPPEGGYPLLFFMHGCCGGNKTSWESGNKTTAGSFDAGGEKWHYNNAWFASRGYVVVTYTARGFATMPNPPADPARHGSTGETQLDSRKFEINDYQSLACQIYANRSAWNAATGHNIEINPSAVVVTGGSYGGGFSWMALTDPIWTCNADTGAAGQQMKLAAVAPKYGWTDLVYSLVPTGRHSALPGALPKTDGCDSGPWKPDESACADPVPVGVPKQSINAGLYGTGTAGTGPGTNATTFPRKIHEAQACLSGTYPGETAPGNPTPTCTSTINSLLSEFLADRSAYYQQQWFDRIASDPAYRVPIFSAATLTDPLFPPHEHRRMHNRIRSVVPGYPLQAYFGDFQHFTQNKAKEWGDLCGADRHVCNDEDFGGAYNANPAALVRLGITTRLNRFIDHYAKPAANPAQAAPAFDVTAALQVCPQKASALATAADEPGATFVATTFEGLANTTALFDTDAPLTNLTPGPTGATTTASAGGGAHADPVATNQTAAQFPDRRQCSQRLPNDPAPAGVVQYTSPPLGGDLLMLGAGRIDVSFAATSVETGSLQLNARLYELIANDTAGLEDDVAVMADRGFRRLSAAEVAANTVSFELFGNGWKFSEGNRIRLEIAQDDGPYLKVSQPPSGLLLTRVAITLPVRTSDAGTGGGTTRRGSGGGALGAGLLACLAGGWAWRRRRGR